MDPTNRRHRGQHGPDCFGCKCQTVMTSPYATPTRLDPTKPPRQTDNSWERGVIRDEKGQPITLGGTPIGVKQYADNRTQIDGAIRSLKQGHEPPPVKLV